MILFIQELSLDRRLNPLDRIWLDPGAVKQGFFRRPERFLSLKGHALLRPYPSRPLSALLYIFYHHLRLFVWFF